MSSLILAASLFGGVETTPFQGTWTKPSVVLITLDTVRADHLGCYGYSHINTPNINRLAADGMRFTNAYAQVPLTLPSHAVILTGTYPMFNGVRDFASTGLRADIPTLAQAMHRNGYRTAAFVSSFALDSMWGLNRGFESYDDNVGVGGASARDVFLLARPGDQTTDRMLDWLRVNSAKPFFIWLHLYDAHSPYRSPEPYRSLYEGHPYDAAIAFDDAQVGRAIQRLRDLGLYDRTLVVLVSDHGESLGEHGESEHGFFIYNSTLRVPLIIKLAHPAPQVGRNQVPGNRLIDQPVGLAGLASTITEACNIPPSRSFQEASLLAPTSQSRPSPLGRVYAESYYARDSFGWHELRAMITADFKYIDAPRPELYDLRRDPDEHENALTAHPALAASFKEGLSELQRQYAAEGSTASGTLDPEVLEKLKSLGYVSSRAPAAQQGDAAADPKDKVDVLRRILRAGDLTRLGRYAEADQMLTELEQAEPELYLISFQKGENELGWEKPAAAVKEFRKSLSLNPSFDQAALGLGRAYFFLGQDQQAAAALELALQVSPRNFLARLTLAKVYWRQDRADKAEPEFSQVVAEHPELAEAHADYGIILAKLRKYREAMRELERGIQSGYRDAITYNYLGICLAELNHPDKALAAYKKSIETDPRYPTAYLNAALLYRKQGRIDEAQKLYGKVCELNDQLCRQYATSFTPVGQ